MGTIRWIIAIIIVHIGLPLADGLPDRLYRRYGHKIEVQRIVATLRQVDMTVPLMAANRFLHSSTSQVYKLRTTPPPAKPLQIPIGVHNDTIVAEARTWLGTPYVFGGQGRSGIDCSAFTQQVFAATGIQLPRSAALQFRAGVPIAQSELQPGDLVFFETYRPGASHVGIYADDGIFVHASSGRNAVTVSRLHKNYYQQRYVGARRIITVGNGASNPVSEAL